jgi:CrcB protein
MIWLIGVGGSLGACIRYLLGKWCTKKMPSIFPFPTWIINISGSFILGILAKQFISGEIGTTTWYLFGVGFCGAYTTYSTFSNEVVGLLLANRVYLAFLYAISSILLGILGAFLGYFFF